METVSEYIYLIYNYKKLPLADIKVGEGQARRKKRAHTGAGGQLRDDQHLALNLAY